MINDIGHRYGSLVVTAREGPNRRCLCDCGKEIVAARGNLARGNTTSCGCRKSPVEDLTGQTHGRVTVLALAGRSGRGSCWLCRCDCGRERVLRRAHILAGTGSCGCSAPRVTPGATFGTWTVLHRVASIPGHFGSRWLCRCACGTEAVVKAGNLRDGASRSCGCLPHPRKKKTQKNPDTAVDVYDK